MNLNSQFSFYPQQPDNPSDADRHYLAYDALTRKGWPEDTGKILKLMSPPPDITNYARPGEFKDVRVAVIGGGLAGLAAAFELRKPGFDITVFEALADRVGGRVYTCYFGGRKDLYNEFGPMRIPVSHETVWHYINTFDLPTRPFIQYNPNSYIFLRKTRVRNDPDGTNVSRHIYPEYPLTDRERTESWQKLLGIGTDNVLLNASPEDRAEIIQVKPLYREKPLIWSDNSTMRIMESAGLSQGAISLVRNFSPLLSGNLYNSFIDYVEEDYPAALTYLYEIPGGMARLPEALHASFAGFGRYPGIPREDLGNVDYRAGCLVDGIYFDSGEGKVGIRYKRLKTCGSTAEKFDYVICAIPFSTLRAVDIDPLFSNIKMRAIREVNYSPAQKSLLLFGERFWEKDWIVGGGSYTDLPLASIWYPSDHARYINDPANAVDQIKALPSNEPGVLIGTYNFNLDTTRLANQPESIRLDRIERELEQVHGLKPGYLDGVVAGFKTVNWDEQPTIRGALSFFSPEQKRLFSFGMTLPEYNERVFFAGEHISAVHRWMQGALQSGMQAANNLAAACKRHRG